MTPEKPKRRRFQWGPVVLTVGTLLGMAWYGISGFSHSTPEEREKLMTRYTLPVLKGWECCASAREGIEDLLRRNSVMNDDGPNG